jgi:hypothetical protein
MAFTLYRLAFDNPLQFYEQFGDPVTTQGGAPVPALRSALRHAVSAVTFLPAGEESTALRLKLRRQWRSLANNTPMKLTGFYLGWDADPEQNGWYLPDQGQLADIEGSSGLATGVFKVENAVWILAGRPRTHRRAMWVYMKPLPTGLWARDFRRVVYNTDFSLLSPLAVSYFPPGVTDLVATGSGAVSTATVLPAGADGAACELATGLLDLARVSYEQPEASINKGQVVAYDRRGEQTAPAEGPGTAWEEFYGADYPYSWLGPEAVAIDTPVLENGRCRMRYSSPNGIGWAIDVWNGTKWVEQGKVLIQRIAPGRSAIYDTELLSASLVEYSETRAVIQAVVKAPSDASSREEVFITLERGWSGPRFEVYPGNNAAGERCDAVIQFVMAVIDTDDSAVKIDSSGAKIAATAKGTGHTGLFEAGVIGASEFNDENEVIVGRWGNAFGVTLAALQAKPSAAVAAATAGYAATHNAVEIAGAGQLGWLAAQLGFPEELAQRALEAENMTLASGTSNTADATASGGKAATATRTSEALHVSQATWPNGDYATYRVFARVRTSAKASKVKIRAKTTTTTGAIKESAAEAYEWVDLGEVVTTNGTLEILAWLSAAGTLYVDRIEAFLLEDRVTEHGGIYEGGRDRGQAALYDSRCIPTVVTRSS